MDRYLRSILFFLLTAKYNRPDVPPSHLKCPPDRIAMRMLRTLFCAALVLLTAAVSTRAESDEAGFRSLFNGQNLEGWTGEDGVWRVENGSIVGESTAEKPLNHNSFLVWNHGDVDDFELRLQFKLTGSDIKTANSGVQYRSGIKPDGHVFGYQADIDTAGNWMGACYDELGRGMLAKRGEKVVIDAEGKREVTPLSDAAELLQAVHQGDWNEYTIICRGPHLIQKMNGQVTVDITDGQVKERELQGVMALQMHSGPAQRVEFKSIRLKRLKLEAPMKKVVFIAGHPSHGWGAHEHNAGCLLLSAALREAAEKDGLPVLTTVYKNGWPKDPTAVDNADTVVSYCDGGGGHFLNPHLVDFDAVMKSGVGLVCIHYAVETTKGECGDKFLDWMGGYFEPHHSVNPHWTANYKEFPKHPTTRGVKPFQINDEWYYHMRFRDKMEGVTPILSDLPSRDTLSRPDGPHSGNPDVRAAVLERKEPQHMGWAYERPSNGGRGFGFTGGHVHRNWQDDNFRKVVLNAIVWTAKGEVPENGINSHTPSDDELDANQDEPKPGK